MTNYIGALDQGTTSTRFMVFDRSGAVVSAAQREHRQIYPKPGWVEHDPEERVPKELHVAAPGLHRVARHGRVHGVEEVAEVVDVEELIASQPEQPQGRHQEESSAHPGRVRRTIRTVLGASLLILALWLAIAWLLLVRLERQSATL